MSGIEDTVRSTLRSAAERAPRSPGALAGGLEVAYRRRRRRSQALIAAAAVVVIAGGGGVALRMTGGQEGLPAANPSGVPSAVVTTEGPPPEPVEKVWPQAVWKIPARDPERRQLRPVAFVDDRTMLVEAWRAFGKTEVIYAYDLAGGELRKIADVPDPAGTVLGTDFGVGDGQVAWWTRTRDTVRLWAVPLSGGEPRPLGDRKVEHDDIQPFGGLDVVGGKVVFSLSSGGVFSVPLAGGQVTEVPGGAGLHLLAWPWAGTPGAGGARDEPPFSRLVNLETGQTSTAVIRQGEQVLACGVRSCTVTTPDGKAYTRLRDGSGQKEIPVGYQIPEPPSQDRFFVRNLTGTTPGIGLYDLTTGTLADLGIRTEAYRGEIPVADRSGRFMTYELKSGRYVIDLSRIP
ncbi:hypothetical protein Misp01_52750 [Microtetraspora sp. NBRC 13810]|uniref:hypothetical protein n=1 Tax=Microtetraspora sp. NBRC 13810 TaxID=3030990 RepID=UPI002555129B|nr:hypothetical protein [Microtetraspora sp. NBRC 13810]GLW10146.1 hypothetical protein Misp01_52750 [Microtetraspora sp. NBRC 13810]